MVLTFSNNYYFLSTRKKKKPRKNVFKLHSWFSLFLVVRNTLYMEGWEGVRAYFVGKLA